MKNLLLTLSLAISCVSSFSAGLVGSPLASQGGKGGIPGIYVTGSGTGTTNGDSTITINITGGGGGTGSVSNYNQAPLNFNTLTTTNGFTNNTGGALPAISFNNVLGAMKLEFDTAAGYQSSVQASGSAIAGIFIDVTNNSGTFVTVAGFTSIYVGTGPQLFTTNGINTLGIATSPGPGVNSEQWGSTASAQSNFDTAIGFGSTASGGSSTALGAGATSLATNSGSFGRAANVPAADSESFAIGHLAQATAANQIRLGVAASDVNIPGTLSVAGKGSFTNGIQVLGGTPGLSISNSVGAGADYINLYTNGSYFWTNAELGISGGITNGYMWVSNAITQTYTKYGARGQTNSLMLANSLVGLDGGNPPGETPIGINTPLQIVAGSLTITSLGALGGITNGETIQVGVSNGWYVTGGPIVGTNINVVVTNTGGANRNVILDPTAGISVGFSGAYYGLVDNLTNAQGILVRWAFQPGNLALTNLTLGIIAGNLTQTNGTYLNTNSTAAGQDWTLLSGGTIKGSNGTYQAQYFLTPTNLSLAGASPNAGISFGSGNALSNNIFTVSGSNDIQFRGGYQTNDYYISNGVMYVNDQMNIRAAVNIGGNVIATNALLVVGPATNDNYLSVGGPIFITNGGSFSGIITNNTGFAWQTNALTWGTIQCSNYDTFWAFATNVTIAGWQGIDQSHRQEGYVDFSNGAAGLITVAWPAGTRFMTGPTTNQPMTTCTVTNGKTAEARWVLRSHLGQTITQVWWSTQQN